MGIRILNDSDVPSWRRVPPPFVYNSEVDDKIRRLGFALLFIWIVVICWITKDYW